MPGAKKTNLERNVASVKKGVLLLNKEVSSLLSDVKRRYYTLDPKTKKKIAAGIAGLGVVLAATAAYRKKRAKK